MVEREETFELEFAKIESARVFIEDHGCKTFMLGLVYSPPDGAGCQGAGLRILDSWRKDLGRRVLNKKAMEIVKYLPRMFYVKEFKHLVNKTCSAIHNNSTVAAIGTHHNEWLDFNGFFDERRERKPLSFADLVHRYPGLHFNGCQFQDKRSGS